MPAPPSSDLPEACTRGLRLRGLRKLREDVVRLVADGRFSGVGVIDACALSTEQFVNM